MVLRCCVCRSNAKSHSNLSFHSVCDEYSPYNCLLSEAIPQKYDIVSVGFAELQDSNVETSLLSVSHNEPTELSAVTPKCKRLLFSTNNLQLTSSRKKVKIINTTRFGDLKTSDFSTPRRAKRNLNLSKLTVANLRKKNKLLRQKNKRLSQKVVSLKDIIYTLSAKNLISDSAACNLKVDIKNNSHIQ